MSQDAIFNLAGESEIQGAIFGAPDEAYQGRVADFLRDLMRGDSDPLTVYWDLINKNIKILVGPSSEVCSVLNELEQELDGSGGMDWEVFEVPAEHILQTTAEWTSRFGSFNVSETLHNYDVAKILTPSSDSRISLATLLERIHQTDEAKAIIFSQASRAELEQHSSVDGDWSQGHVYVLSDSGNVPAAVEAAFSSPDHTLAYSAGEAGTTANPSPVKDTFGL
jgi:hypothetical protein